MDKEHFERQRLKEAQSKDEIDVPKEVLKLYKLRKLISIAWLPLGIGRDEAADILLWAVGEDVKHLNFNLWPQRIMENTGIMFNPTQDTIINVLQRVAKEWQKKKIKPVYIGGVN